MLSSKLLRVVSEHWEEIAVRVQQRIRADSELMELGKLPEAELRGRAREILLNLGHWMVSKEEDPSARYESLGRHRFHEGIPLHEVVHALQLIRECMVDYVRDQGMGVTPLDLYAEEELEHGADRVFDRIIYCFVRGYESAMREHHAMAMGR
jgi:hypothetical protein